MRTRWLTVVVGYWLSGIAACAHAADRGPPIAIDLGDGVEIKLALVPAGTFQQGSPDAEAGRAADETPRQVTLSKPFYLGIYPVTRGQFAQFVKATGYRTEAEQGKSGGFGWDGESLKQRKEFTWRNPGFPQTDSHPVTIVSFADAEAFCQWLQKKADRKCALPTEAQWEYACRAGATTPFYQPELATIAWFKANANSGTHPVGEKAANAFGLYDMSGNVFEWCRDWYGPYDAGPATDPLQTRDNLSDKPRRVLRGGSWLREAKDCRSAARYKNSPGSRNADNGFRVVAAIELTKPGEKPAAPAERPGGAGDHSGQPVERPADVVDHTGPPAEQFTPVAANDASEPAAAPPSRPLAAAPMQAVELPHDDGGSLLWILALVVVLGVVALLVFRLLFRGAGNAAEYDPRPRPAPPPTTGGTVHRIVDDGFWLGALSGMAGQSLRYRCMLNGQPHFGNTVIQSGPQGHFVYTGGTPSNVQILGIDPPGVNTQDNPAQPATPDLPPTQPIPSSEPFLGTPPAY